MTTVEYPCRRPIGILVFAFLAPIAAPSAARAWSPMVEVERIGREIEQAERLLEKGKHDEAITLLEGTLERVKRLVGPGDPSTAAVSSGLARAYAGAGRYADAERLLREALAIAEARAEISKVDRLNITNNLIEVLLKTAKFDEAVRRSEETLKLAETELGEGDWRTNLIRDTLAKCCLLAKRPADAIGPGRRTLAFAEARHGADAPETIPYRNTLGMALMRSGQYNEAEALFQKSLQIAKARLPADHEHTTTTMNNLAGVKQLMGKAAEAAALAGDAVERVEGRADAKPEDASTLVGLGVSKLNAGDYARAEQLFLRALEIVRSSLGPDHPDVAAILGNLATLYYIQGRYIESEWQAALSLEMARRNPGPDSVAAAKALINLAGVYLKTGRHAEAETKLSEAYEILKDRLEPGHPDTAFVIHNLASLYWTTNRFAEAVQFGTRALGDIEKRLARDTRFTALILLNLGQSYVGLRQFEAAEAHLRRARAILEAEVGPRSVETAVAYNSLAGICQFTHRYDEAEALYRRAIAACEANLSADHPETANPIDNLAVVLTASGRMDEAADQFDRSRRLRRGFLHRTLPALSEDDQIALLDSGERISLDAALSLASKTGSDPEMAARSAEWILNGKALALEALAQRALLARDVDNPDAAPLLKELDATRGRLAAMAFARDKEGHLIGVGGGEYGRLVTRERELARKLGPTLRNPAAAGAWADLSAVRAALPADAVLVEFARSRVIDVKPEPREMAIRPSRYLAWVIPPAGLGEVSLIDLGPADDIDRSVAEVLRGVQPEDDLPLRPADEPAVEGRLLASLRPLADLVLGPLRQHLGPARRWVLSPDSALWLIPWAALPVEEGRYAIEDHLIHLTVSGRDLIAPRPAAGSAAPAILADPDYDLAPGRASARARELGFAATRSASAPRSPRRAGSLHAAFDRLAGTKVEADAIKPLMKDYAGSEPRVYLGADASETVFKALRGPKALVLSTHGFFLSAPEVVEGTGVALPGTPPPRPRPGILDNPLLRCGLVMAGYNRFVATDPGETDDGLLTGLEVVGSDLRGTDLVVLSACETALGEVRVGEGVAGLLQSFQLAGADAVVASLWRVQDLESYQLMATFFEGLARRRGPAVALREAQLSMIADRRARHGAAHPRFWAAFSLNGSPGPNWRDELVVGSGSHSLPRLPPALPDAPSGPNPRTPASDMAISPVTGRPDCEGPWSDGAMAVVLLSGGGVFARWWWRRGAGEV